MLELLIWISTCSTVEGFQLIGNTSDRTQGHECLFVCVIVVATHYVLICVVEFFFFAD